MGTEGAPTNEPSAGGKTGLHCDAGGSYGAAALVAGKWGCEVDDSVIHALVQRVGSKAEAQTQERLKQVPQESQPQRKASELALLMRDGWFARFRGPGWGKKTTKKERVEWHEIKNGVFYLHEQSGQTQGGRGVIADKTVVRWQGEPLELEPRLHWLRHGQEQAVLKEIAALKVPRGQAGKAVRKQKNYFAGQAGRMNYKEIADHGWPIGSGPVESSCAQDQCRFKRPGQFWTPLGFRHLSALDEARRNDHWDQLWLAA